MLRGGVRSLGTDKVNPGGEKRGGAPRGLTERSRAGPHLETVNGLDNFYETNTDVSIH